MPNFIQIAIFFLSFVPQSPPPFSVTPFPCSNCEEKEFLSLYQTVVSFSLKALPTFYHAYTNQFAFVKHISSFFSLISILFSFFPFSHPFCVSKRLEDSVLLVLYTQSKRERGKNFLLTTRK